MTAAETVVHEANSNAQSSRLERITATLRAFDKKKVAKVGGIVVTVGGVIVAGALKGLSEYSARE